MNLCQARHRPQGILCALPRTITKHGANPAAKIVLFLLDNSITLSPRPPEADVSGRQPAADAQHASAGDDVATVSPKNTEYPVFFMRNVVSHARISCARGFSYKLREKEKLRDTVGHADRCIPELFIGTRRQIPRRWRDRCQGS